MCGRYALSLGAGAVRVQVEEELDRPIGAWEDEDNYNPARGYNIAPRTRNPIIRIRGGASDGRSDEHNESTKDNAKSTHDDAPKKSNTETILKMENMQWGLIPHWMKRPPEPGQMLKTINARDDTIIEGGSMWKSIRGRKRCIVLAEGFYEWLHKGSERIPHYIKRKDGKILCIAGLWDSVHYEGEKEELHTYTIITTDCNKQMAFLHNRMPVILPDAKAIATWLDTSEGTWTPELVKLLKPFEGELEIYPVPKEVGKVGTQSSDFLKPVSERKGNIASFFAKQSQKKEEKEEESASPVKEKRDEKINSPKAKKEKSISPEAGKTHKEDTSAKTESKEEETSQEIIEMARDVEGSSGQASERKDEKDDHPELVLNPDEGDEVVSANESQEDGKGKSKAIVLDNSSEEGDAADPIVLEDEASDSKAKPLSSKRSSRRTTANKASSTTSSTNKGKKSSTTTGQAKRKRESQSPEPSLQTKSMKTTKSTRSTRSSNSSGSKASKSREATAATDDHGNKKLENYFEIEDD